jgi:ribosomal protein RSM22 (predicted rRNA methylase)
MAVLLKRSSIKHVREAAEKGYGGPGLPFSPSTPRNMRNGKMDQVGLRATQYHMTDIEADAFLAAFMAPAYSSAVSVFTEVRRRLGTGWMRNLLMKRGKGETDHGPSVLDYGMGGAGLAAWREVALAEWEAMDEEAREEKKRRQQQTARGKSGGGTETPADASAPADAAATTDAAATANAATPSSPPPPNSRRRDEIPGQGTVIIGSLALRARVSRFLGNTSFLRRLPDYTHLATPKHLDAPATPQNRKMFDIILVGHQLLPTEEGHRRRAILNNLWEMLNPDGGVLVVLERANPRGFEAVAEARAQLLRDFILPPNADPGAPATVDEAWQRVREPGFIVAPCTNHATCPMYTTPGVSHGRKDFCHFSQRFVMPHFLRAITRSTLGNDSEVEHSYVAVQRGTAPSLENPQIAAQRAFRGYADADEAPDMLSLPRMLLPPLKNKGHIVLDVCTPDARLERWTVPKSHGRLAYHDARKSRWGDLWALGAKIRVDKNVRLGRHGENAERQEGSGKGKAPAPERRTKGGRKPKIERLMAELEEAVADDDGSTLKRGKVVQRRKREEDE